MSKKEVEVEMEFKGPIKGRGERKDVPDERNGARKAVLAGVSARAQGGVMCTEVREAQGRVASSEDEESIVVEFAFNSVGRGSHRSLLGRVTP